MTRELASARWETKVSGLVALTRDWAGPGLPPLTLNPPARLTLLEPADVRDRISAIAHRIAARYAGRPLRSLDARGIGG